jgi:enamine deaminase RidA (YjgF/YER057c/UK114 family)
MTAIERQQIGPRLSQACAYGPTVYLARQVADDPSADVIGQTEQILRKVDQFLAAPEPTRRFFISHPVNSR